MSRPQQTDRDHRHSQDPSPWRLEASRPAHAGSTAWRRGCSNETLDEADVYRVAGADRGGEQLQEPKVAVGPAWSIPAPAARPCHSDA